MKIIVISGVIGWDVEPSDIRDQLNKANGEDVEVQINSPGGFVFPGLEIMNMLKNYSGNVTVRIVGLAASMASVIAMVGDEVIAEDTAVFMIHNARAVVGGDHHQMRKTAKHIESISNLVASKYIAKTGKPSSVIIKMMDVETFLFGEEILKEGFVDRIVETSDKKDKAQAVQIASGSIENCLSQMKKSEAADNDLEQAAASIDTSFSASGDFDPVAGEKLGAFLNRTIDRMAGDDSEERSRLIRRMASAAGIAEDTVRQILNGSIVCPPIARLRAFAGVLDVSLQSIVNAAEQDGCDYSEEEDSAKDGGCGGGT